MKKRCPDVTRAKGKISPVYADGQARLCSRASTLPDKISHNGGKIFKRINLLLFNDLTP